MIIKLVTLFEVENYLNDNSYKIKVTDLVTITR